MRVYQGMTFADMVGQITQDFLGAARPVDVGQWQGLDIKGDANKVTWELREAVLAMRMPDTIDQGQREYRPNLPWAEDHFRERISTIPLNPPPSNEWWPHAQEGHKKHLKDGRFSHTYPERFWPKYAGFGGLDRWDNPLPRWGIRFPYGDLADVALRMIKNPYTRQAYLPVWFPEDNGAPEGERVPCSLGYHFMVRDGQMHLTYHIRACDFMRHFRDDVYMAFRLAWWMRDQLQLHVDDCFLDMGELTMHIGSFHIFAGDRAMVKHLAHQYILDKNRRITEALS